MAISWTLVAALLVGLCLLPASVTGILDGSCVSRKAGSFWAEPNKGICTCKDGLKKCFNQISHCNGWGDVHYTSFDGKKFDFQGPCQYILARTCYGKNKFSIEIEQVPWSFTTSVAGNFRIRYDQYTVLLSKPYSIKVYIGDTLCGSYQFFDDANLRCELVDTYVYVSLKKLKVWFRWNFVYHFDVWVHKVWYKRKMCGLCGDANGFKGNDLKLTPHHDTVSGIIEWGESWKALDRRQPVRCRCSASDPTPPVRPPCSEYQSMMDQCATLMRGPFFKRCNDIIDPDPFINNCQLEMCECGRESRNGCLCVGASGYVEACKAAGVTVDMSWTSDYNCSVCQDPDSGLIYQHGQSWTYQCNNRSCDNGMLSSNKFSCCSHTDLFYPDGEIRVTRCNKYVCTNTEWHYKARICCFDDEAIYQLGSKWKKNQCTTCKCHTNGTVTCVSEQFSCPSGFVSTGSCCCIPDDWIDSEASKGDTGVDSSESNTKGVKGTKNKGKGSKGGHKGGPKRKGRLSKGGNKGGQSSEEKDSKGDTGGHGNGNKGGYKGGHSSKGKKGGNKGAHNGKGKVKKGSNKGTKGKTGAKGKGSKGGYKGGPSSKGKARKGGQKGEHGSKGPGSKGDTAGSKGNKQGQ